MGKVSQYHSNVEKGIIAFGKKRKRFSKTCGSNIPIHINHPTKKMYPIIYHPDIQFVTKVGKRLIFEILDSEIRDSNLIIADILQACLSPNTSDVIFTVPKQEDQDKVSDLYQTVTDNLISKGISKKDLPRFYVYYILRSEAKTPESVTEIFTDLFP